LMGAPARECAAALWIDGIRRVDFSEFELLLPEDIAAIEVYPHALTVPARFLQARGRCGVVAVWTKWSVR
jgi:hypothetical protein